MLQFSWTHIYGSIKTTLEIADPLLREAKQLAARDGTTLRELVESGLRAVVSERSTRKPFKLRDANFNGGGSAKEFEKTPGQWLELMYGKPGVDSD